MRNSQLRQSRGTCRQGCDPVALQQLLLHPCTLLEAVRRTVRNPSLSEKRLVQVDMNVRDPRDCQEAGPVDRPRTFCWCCCDPGVGHDDIPDGSVEAQGAFDDEIGHFREPATRPRTKYRWPKM